MNNKIKKSNITIKELPADERPREKLLRYGCQFLSNGELLAILIGTGTRQVGALRGGANSCHGKTGISHLTDCTPEELCRIEGMGIAKSCKVVAAIELGNELPRARGKRDIPSGLPKRWRHYTWRKCAT